MSNSCAGISKSGLFRGQPCKQTYSIQQRENGLYLCESHKHLSQQEIDELRQTFDRIKQKYSNAEKRRKEDEQKKLEKEEKKKQKELEKEQKQKMKEEKKEQKELDEQNKKQKELEKEEKKKQKELRQECKKKVEKYLKMFMNANLDLNFLMIDDFILNTEVVGIPKGDNYMDEFLKEYEELKYNIEAYHLCIKHGIQFQTQNDDIKSVVNFEECIEACISYREFILQNWNDVKKYIGNVFYTYSNYKSRFEKSIKCKKDQIDELRQFKSKLEQRKKSIEKLEQDIKDLESDITTIVINTEKINIDKIVDYKLEFPRLYKL